VKQLGFAWFQVVQNPVALSFHVPALPLPACSSGSRVILPSGVKVILNFVPEGDTAVNGCPLKKVAFISFGAMGSAVKAALAPRKYYCEDETYAQHANISCPGPG
jgi:predicted permease